MSLDFAYEDVLPNIFPLLRYKFKAEINFYRNPKVLSFPQELFDLLQVVKRPLSEVEDFPLKSSKVNALFEGLLAQSAHDAKAFYRFQVT